MYILFINRRRCAIRKPFGKAFAKPCAHQLRAPRCQRRIALMYDRLCERLGGSLYEWFVYLHIRSHMYICIYVYIYMYMVYIYIYISIHICI